MSKPSKALHGFQNNGRLVRLRRHTAAILLAVFSLAAPACRKAPRQSERQGPQVIVLGFDGVDPTLAARWMSEGKLPNLERLAREGTFCPLGTTNPPESPVAWASFATGLNPGGTGVFDFLTRDPKTYFPSLALSKARKAKFLLGLVPLRRTEVTNERHGIPFYKAVADAGYRAVVLRMPLEFPPTPLPDGKLWAGLGVPDARGAWGTFFYFGTDIQPWEAGDTEFGGRLVSLELHGGAADASVEGPPNPAARGFTRLTAPIRFTVHPHEDAVDVHFGGRSETLTAGHWSGWFRADFRVNRFFSATAISRFYVIRTSPDLDVYMPPLNIDPMAPALPISSPADFATTLARQHGLFKTLGWWHDTWALNEEKITDGVFLDDAFRTMKQLADITVDELERDHPRLLVSVFTSTDSVSHMFYRLIDTRSPRYDSGEAMQYGDAILSTYERMDGVIGRVEKAMEPGATLIVVSDHGFHAFRRGFNTNTWLVANGYMKLRQPGAAGKVYTLSDLFGRGDFFPNVDWGQTRAYALGLGQIYLNLRGREREGVVKPGAEASRLIAGIRARLLAYRDPETHEPVLEDVYPGSQIFQGPYAGAAPDLQLDFRPGYRTSWQTSLGAIPPGIVVTNTRKWSGDHCSSDPADTSGVLFSNRRLLTPHPGIMDIAPTVLALFRVRPLSAIDGRTLHLAR